MYNKKVLNTITANLNKAKKPAAPKDIIMDPRGQWAHPGEVTRIPSNRITMQGVGYPVLGVPNKGKPMMMNPGQEYQFPNAEYVDEYPQMQTGGQTFTYAGRPGSYYKKDVNGKWMIKNEGTKGKYIAVQDPKGTKTKLLNAQAKPIASTMKSPALQHRRYDPMYNPGFDKAFVAESTAVNKVQPKPLPTVKEQMAADRKAVTKQITDKNKKVKEYYKEYHESPRYTEMLQQSDPNNWMDYYLGRNENLETPRVYIQHKQPFDEPSTGGFSSNKTGDITVLPKGFNVKGLLPHEWSHSIDRPLNPWAINSYTNRHYNLGNNYNMRLIPEKDQQWMKTHRAKDWYHSPEFQKLSPIEKKYAWTNVNDPWAKANAKQQKEWFNYVGTDTETRARLNDIRYHSKKRGIYDPFTEKVSPDIYKHLLNTKFETGEEEGFDALKQLKDVYTDEEIQWMLNNISQNQEQDQEDIEQGVARKGGSLKKYSRSLEATNKLFRESPLLKKSKSKKKKIYDPNSKYYQDGGEQDGMNAMMKARLAYANEFGNPAAQRMINLPDNPYEFDDGNTGTHYMASMDNYAVPQIQDENGQLMLGDYGPDSREAMRFDSDEDANYFAEHYKDVSPGFIEADLTPEEIQEYARGGYIIEDVSVPQLTQAQNGGEYTYGDRDYKKDSKGNWSVAVKGVWTPLSKNVEARTKELNKNAKFVKKLQGYKSSGYDMMADNKPQAGETTQKVAQDYMRAKDLKEVDKRTEAGARIQELYSPGHVYEAMTDAQIMNNLPADLLKAAQEGVKNKMYKTVADAGRDYLIGQAELKGNRLNRTLVKDPLTGKLHDSREAGSWNNYNDGPIQSADWFWTLPILGTSAGMSALTADLPALAGNIGRTNLLNNAATRGVLGSDLLGAGQFASKYGTVDKLLKGATYAKTLGYAPKALSSAYHMGNDLISLQGDLNKKQKSNIQNNFYNNLSSLGDMAYDTFLDYGPTSKVTSLLKLGKYAPRSAEGNDLVASYKSLKNLGRLTGRKEGGDANKDYLELDLTDEEIAEYAKGGFIIEDVSVPSVGNYKQGGALLTKKVTCKKCGWKWDAADGGNDMTTCHKCGGQGLVHAQKGGGLPKAQLGQNVQNDSGYRTSTEALQGLIKQRDSDLSYARTPAQKAQVNKQYDQAIKDATSRQNLAYKTANAAGTKQVKNIITTSDKAKQIKADKIAKEKAEAEYYAAELAKNNGEVPDSKYAYLDERAAPVADNTRVDPSYLPFAQQEAMFANQAQDEEERQQEDDYRTHLALTKGAQDKGFKNTYDYKYNPKGQQADITQREAGIMGYDSKGNPMFWSEAQKYKYNYDHSPWQFKPAPQMHSGAAGSADWFWTLPLAIPAAIEGLGALAGTTLGSAAEAAFAIDGANMIYEGKNALEIANAMPENTYEQKVAKLDAQNEAYASMSLGALDAVPFGIGKLRQASKLTNLTKARTASSEVALAKSPLQKFIGNTGATAKTVAKNAELPSTRSFAEGIQGSLMEDDVLSQYYKEKAMSELNGQQDMYDYGEDLYDYNDWDAEDYMDDYDPFNGATEDEINNAIAPGDDDIDNPFAGIAQNDLDDMFARLEAPAIKSNQLPTPPSELNLPGLDTAPPRVVPSYYMELNTQRNILSDEYNTIRADIIKYQGSNIPRAMVDRADALREGMANIDGQLRTINATPVAPAPQVLGQIDLTRPNNYSTPIPDPSQVQRFNPFPGLRGEREVTTAPLRRNTMYGMEVPIPETGMTIGETLAQHDNPLNVVNEIRTIAQKHLLDPETTTELMEALRTEIRKMPIATDAKKFLIKEAKRISNVPKTTPYTGSTVSEEEFFSFYQSIPETERVGILNEYGYTPDDLMNLEARYDDNDALMSITMNQVYDDLKYMVNHGMPNPNAHVINLKTGELSPVLKKQTELYTSGVSQKAVKKIEDTVYIEPRKKQTTGQVSYSRVNDPTIYTLKDTKIIPKTKDLDDLIYSYEEAIDKLQDGILKDSLTTQLEDYKSTKWLRTEYAAELKEKGLNPNKIEKASIISNSSNQKNLIDEDGNVLGTLNAYKAKTNEDLPGFQIGSTGVNYKFHPYSVGTKHSKFKDWDEASEYFQNQLLSDKLLSLTSEADRNNPIVLKNFRRQAKVEAEELIKQLKENNNNRWGEALYRGVHHGVKDTKGAVFTEQSFAPTTLPDAITKEPIERYRAQDYWNSQAKQMNDMGIPKAEFVIASPNSSRSFSEEQIIIRRKQGGNLDKLNKFIH